jgi:CBS domain-containing protein
MKSLKVRDYMAADLLTFTPNSNVLDAMAQFLDKGISGAPVVDDAGALVGVLSEVDLIEVVVQDSYYNENVGIVGDYMQTEVEWVDPEMDIFSLAQRFIKHHRRRFPVMEDGKLIGQISRRDVLRAAMDLSLE